MHAMHVHFHPCMWAHCCQGGCRQPDTPAELDASPTTLTEDINKLKLAKDKLEGLDEKAAHEEAEAFEVSATVEELETYLDDEMKRQDQADRLAAEERE